VTTSVAGLLTIRVLTQCLGTEQYAVYSVLVGLQGWFLLADFGLGASVQNHISERRAHSESYDQVIAGTGVVLAITGIITLTALVQFAPWIAPLVLQKFPFLPAAEKIRCFLVVSAAVAIAAQSGVVARVWYAEQRGYLANGLPALSSIFSLGWVSLLAHFDVEDRLFWSLLGTYAPLALLPLPSILGRTVASLQRTGLQWRSILRPVMIRACKFWGFALMANGVLQIDYLIMAQYLAPHQIVEYNLTAKIFNLCFFMYAAILQALWPVCAEAVARREWAGVLRQMRRYIVVGWVLVMGFSISLIFAMPMLVRLLSPKDPVHISGALIAAFCGYYLLRVWCDTVAMVLQSMSYLRPFWLLVPVQALICFSMQWVLVPRFGVLGVLLGLCGSFAGTVTWGLPLALKYRWKRLGEMA
jgi:O-antigen/teichoic acid export membrane protein